jgi:hypothetical protein
MSNIRQFYEDSQLREAMLTSLEAFLSNKVLDHAFRGQPITGMKEARDIYREWIKYLGAEFDIKQIPKVPEYARNE